MPAVNVRLKNFGKGPRGLYNSHGRAVVVDPGQEAPLGAPLDPLPAKGQVDAPKPASPNGRSPHGVSIPVDWQSLSWPKLRGLASKVSPEKIMTMEDAKRAITAALAKE
jgi:hypothetical protein